MLLENGHEVIALDCFLNDSYDSSIKRRNADFINSKKYNNLTWQNRDLRLDHLDDLIDEAEVIYNLAAMPGQIRSWDQFELFVHSNLLTVSRILQSPKINGKKFVQASTSSVYGEIPHGDEDYPLNPISPYGVTKLAAEKLILAFHQAKNIDFKILRFFSVFGPRQRPDMAISRFITAMTQGKPIELYGNGQAARSFTYVADCARATMNAGLRFSKHHVYNISGKKTYSIRHVINEIANILQIDPIIVDRDPRIGDQFITNGDNTKASADLDLYDSISLSEGIRLQIEWALRQIPR